MKLSRAQTMMVDDGFPKELFRTPAQRHDYWEAHPPRAMPLFELNKARDESPETAAFRAQEEERRRLKSLEGIARMKARMATKAIGFSKVRWDARRNKFVPLAGGTTKSAPTALSMSAQPVNRGRVVEAGTPGKATVNRVTDPIWFRVNKGTAAALAKLNGVWDDKYAKLSGGLLVMSVTNRLKGLIKKGGEVKWQ